VRPNYELVMASDACIPSQSLRINAEARHMLSRCHANTRQGWFGRTATPYRIVIRNLGDQHVVHTEVLEHGKEPWYHQGDYFRKRDDVATPDESDAVALRKAWARFKERARRSLRMEAPPAKRLAEVADIAKTIINALLPEDEDEHRELIGDDYQLESDIETFEQLTGKIIQPEDDEPILGDEIAGREADSGRKQVRREAHVGNKVLKISS
jgi:hypothetical protein